MGYIAVEAVEDALERSKEILSPFDFMTWTRLAVIMIFVGGSGISGFTNFPFSSFSSFEDSGTEFEPSPSPTGFDSSVPSTQFDQAITGLSTASPGASEAGLLILVGSLLLFIGVAFLYLGSLAKFVLFRGLDEKEISIRQSVGKHYFDAVKYMLFNIGLIALVVGSLAGLIGSFFVNLVLGIGITLIFIPLMIVVAVLGGLVNDFALLEIIRTDKGFIESVRDAVSDLLEHKEEFGVYLLMRLVITTLIGIISFTATMAVKFIYLLVFGLIAVGLGAINSTLALIPVTLGILVWMITALYLKVPFTTYLYSYYVELYRGFME